MDGVEEVLRGKEAKDFILDKVEALMLEDQPVDMYDTDRLLCYSCLHEVGDLDRSKAAARHAARHVAAAYSLDIVPIPMDTRQPTSNEVNVQLVAASVEGPPPVAVTQRGRKRKAKGSCASSFLGA